MKIILFRNVVIALMPFILMALSCSNAIPEKQAKNAPAKVLEVKNPVPSCCSNKPSRFFPKPHAEINFN